MLTNGPFNAYLTRATNVPAPLVTCSFAPAAHLFDRRNTYYTIRSGVRARGLCVCVCVCARACVCLYACVRVFCV